jgi:hypothetical protein
MRNSSTIGFEGGKYGEPNARFRRKVLSCMQVEMRNVPRNQMVSRATSGKTALLPLTLTLIDYFPKLR